MCPLRLVNDERAGPNALGILVPPGARTFLILRPRALAWDLVLLRDDGSAFANLSRPLAQASAQSLLHALEEGIESPDPFEAAQLPDAGFWLRVRLRRFLFVVCPRAPGQIYRPQLFSNVDAAQAVADLLGPLFNPPRGTVQEIYCNAHHFHN